MKTAEQIRDEMVERVRHYATAATPPGMEPTTSDLIMLALDSVAHALVAERQPQAFIGTRPEVPAFPSIDAAMTHFERPREPGFYWWKRNTISEWTFLEVFREGSHLMAAGIADGPTRMSNLEVDGVFGPRIEPPK